MEAQDNRGSCCTGANNHTELAGGRTIGSRLSDHREEPGRTDRPQFLPVCSSRIHGQIVPDGGQTTNLSVERVGESSTLTSLTLMVEESDEDFLDYESSPERRGMDINVIYLSSTHYSLLGDDEVEQFAFRPQDTILKKPMELDNHFNPLYIKGHLDGAPISHVFVDGEAMVNMMPYSTYKKMGKSDVELIQMNMTINGVGGGEPIGAKGVASMELTVRSKTMPTAFFIVEV